MKKLLIVVLIALLAFVGYALFAPSPFDPQAWTPPTGASATAGVSSDRQTLAQAQRLAAGLAIGPEDVAIDAQGRLYAGYEDGTIRRFDADGTNAQVFATTNGRPLGLAFAKAPLFADTPNTTAQASDAGQGADSDSDQAQTPGQAPGQTLIVADADQGLLAVDPSGRITVLTHSAGDAQFAFTDDVDVADDGTIYFTDASSKYGQHAYRSDILEHGGHGRLLAYDPDTKKARVLMDGLQFANGVAVGPDDAWVLITETGSYRVLRHWLTGERAGQNDIFIDNLPGFPDGISYNGDGTFWLALFAPRNAVLDFAGPHPWLRRIIFHLPEAIQPKPAHVGRLLGLDREGRITADLIDDGESAFAPITSVEQSGDQLYLGSLSADAFARLPVPSTAPDQPAR